MFYQIKISNFILPAHKPVQLLHTVYTDRLWTERKYKCKCTANAILCCSHNCTDTAVTEFMHLKCWFKLKTHHALVDFCIALR